MRNNRSVDYILRFTSRSNTRERTTLTATALPAHSKQSPGAFYLVIYIDTEQEYYQRISICILEMHSKWTIITKQTVGMFEHSPAKKSYNCSQWGEWIKIRNLSVLWLPLKGGKC